MKKILLIISILAFNLLSAQVVKLGSSTINGGPKGDKGDMPSFTINGTTVTDGTSLTITGEGNPNQALITNQIELVNAANAGKDLLITTDFSLSSNASLPSNSLIVYAGGTINLNGFQLQGFDNNWSSPNDAVLFDAYTGSFTGTWQSPCEFTLDNVGAKSGGTTVMAGLSITSGSNIVTSSSYTFTSADIGKKCAIVGGLSGGLVLNATITAVTPNVTISSNATATVSDANGTISYDNWTVINNALFLLNQSSSVLNGSNKIYYHSTKATELANYMNPTNLTIKGNNIGFKNVSFQLTPHDLNSSETLVIDKATNTTLENVKLYGDLLIHGTQGLVKTEANHGFVWRTLAKNVIMNNCTAANFYGDGGIGKGDMQFTNYIDGSAGVSGNTVSTVAVGSISQSDGLTVDTGDTSKIYTPSFIDIDTAAFTSQLETGYPNKSYKLSGRSFAGWASLRTPYYRAFYYDQAQTTLLAVSPIQYIYDEIPLKEEWKFVRFEMDAPIDITTIELMAAPQKVANGLIWKGGEVYGNGRDGISNPPDNATFENISFFDNGYLTGGPGYHFNAEDRRRGCRNLKIIGCTFRNGFGSIKLVGTENAIIKDNIMLPNTQPYLAGDYNYTFAGLDVAFGRNTVISGNIVYERGSSFGRSDFVYGNRFIGGSLTFSSNGNVFENNYCLNTRLVANTDADENRVGYPSKVKNNRFIYNRTIPNSTHLFIDKNKTIAFIDNEFIFNDITHFSYATTQTDFMVLGASSTNRMFLNVAPTTDFGGYWDGNIFKGANTGSSQTTGDMTPPLKDFNNNTIETNLSFKNDLVGSFTSKNNTIYGFLYLELDRFPTVSGGTNETLRFEDYKIIIDDRWDFTNINSKIFKTEARYVDLEFYNTIFDVQIAVATPNARYFSVKTFGSLLLDNCTFKAITATTIDFTNATYFPNITSGLIIDPIVSNVTFTVPSTIKIVFTKASPLMATYATFADDAAAATAGYPSGYMYMTATGEFRIKL